MSAATNIVLYAAALHGDGKGDGKRVRGGFVADFSLDHRRALVSIADGDAFGFAKVQAAAMQEYARNDRQGTAHSPLCLVRETREADEQGKLTRADYTLVDPVTMKDVGDVLHSLDDVFALATERK